MTIMQHLQCCCDVKAPRWVIWHTTCDVVVRARNVLDMITLLAAVLANLPFLEK